MNKFKIFILTIKRNKERYEQSVKLLLEQGFKEEEIVIFFGIDYKENSLNEIKSKFAYFSPNSVLACAASHILLWKYISTFNDLDYAIILEDDSVLDKKLFETYKSEIENKIKDNVFINFSSALTINKFKDLFKNNPNSNFVESELILSLDTYLLTPKLADKIFSFYKKNKPLYHIDLHLAFVKKEIPMSLLYFKKNISYPNLRSKSSMVQHNKKTLSFLEDTETYKNINTPILEINNFILSCFSILIIVFFFILVFFTFKIKTKNNYSETIFNLTDIILFISWFFLGILIYDII